MQMHKEDLTIFKICNIVQSREIHFLLLLLTDKIDIMQTYPLQRKGWYIAREPFLWYFPTAPGALIVGSSAGGRANELLLLVSIKRRLHLKIQYSALSPGPEADQSGHFMGRTLEQASSQLIKLNGSSFAANFGAFFSLYLTCCPNVCLSTSLKQLPISESVVHPFFATQFRPEHCSVSTRAWLQEMWRFSFGLTANWRG